MRRLDVEWIAFAAGVKPAIRRAIEPSMAASWATRAAEIGASVSLAASSVSSPSEPSGIVYVARSQREADALRDAEASILPGSTSDPSPDAHTRLGRALGFPACCVAAFSARLRRGVDRLRDGAFGGDEDYVAARDAWVPLADPLINPLLMIHRRQLISFYPCRYDCGAARAVADATRGAVAAVSHDDARALVAALTGTLVVAPNGGRAWVKIDAGRRVEAASAPLFDDDRAPRAIDTALAASLVGTESERPGAQGPKQAAPSPFRIDFWRT